MANPAMAPLPANHPDLQNMLLRRSKYRSGQILGICLAVFLLLLMIFKWGYKALKSTRNRALWVHGFSQKRLSPVKLGGIGSTTSLMRNSDSISSLNDDTMLSRKKTTHGSTDTYFSSSRGFSSSSESIAPVPPLKSNRIQSGEILRSGGSSSSLNNLKLDGTSKTKLGSSDTYFSSSRGLSSSSEERIAPVLPLKPNRIKIGDLISGGFTPTDSIAPILSRKTDSRKMGEGIKGAQSFSSLASSKFDGSSDKLIGSTEKLFALRGHPSVDSLTPIIPLQPLQKRTAFTPTIKIISKGDLKNGPRTSFVRPPPIKEALLGEEVVESPTELTPSPPSSSTHPLPPPLPPKPIHLSLAPRNWLLASSTLKNEAHKGQPLYDYMKNLSLPPLLPPASIPESETIISKQSSRMRSLWTFLTLSRIPGTDWNIGNALWISLFVLINLISLASIYLTNGDLGEIKLGLGSLAAANSMILIIPATRNSVLTLMLGLPFDHVIVYHRFLGRFALTCVALHAISYIPQFQIQEFVHWTGLVAAICGLIIFISSLDWVRRKHFSAFFWLHYSFIGFYLFAYLHLREARPFLLIGIALFALDVALRSLWSIIPRRCTVFRNKGEVCHVRFQKNPITEFLGAHQVGQYFFGIHSASCLSLILNFTNLTKSIKYLVNFPELSLTEWHPFSVSSGCRETEVELHIRALGDHTKRIVALAKECGNDRSIRPLPWIRFDGPYGKHDFNYRRYPVLLLVGGGIGITPILGLIKDIYSVGKYPANIDSPKPHVIEAVYVAWILPRKEDAEVFMPALKECMQKSLARIPGGRFQPPPPLVVWIYITKASSTSSLEEPYIAGRPNFPSIFEVMEANHGSHLATLTFGCGPGPMISELWDLCVKHTKKDSRRLDFFHEVFNF